MTYMLNGKQYLVVSVSGSNVPGSLMAFTLPSENSVAAGLSVARRPLSPIQSGLRRGDARCPRTSFAASSVIRTL